MQQMLGSLSVTIGEKVTNQKLNSVLPYTKYILDNESVYQFFLDKGEFGLIDRPEIPFHGKKGCKRGAWIAHVLLV
jgi:hypothetical protein